MWEVPNLVIKMIKGGFLKSYCFRRFLPNWFNNRIPSEWNLYAVINATTAQIIFSGAALDPPLTTNDVLSFGFREEYFLDDGVGVIDLNLEDDKNEIIFQKTLSGNYNVGNLAIIPEIRIDIFTQKIVLPDFEKINETEKSLL